MYSAVLVSVFASLSASLPTTSPAAIDLANKIVARAPAAANPVLRSVTGGGSGCPFTPPFNFANGAATAAFDYFQVDNAVPSNEFKNCAFTIDIGLDPAWRYTIGTSSIYQGYTDGSWAKLEATYTAGAQQINWGFTENIQQGAGAWQVQKSGGVQSDLGGGVATVNVLLGLKTGGTGNYVALDSLDLVFAFSN